MLKHITWISNRAVQLREQLEVTLKTGPNPPCPSLLLIAKWSVASARVDKRKNGRSRSSLWLSELNSFMELLSRLPKIQYLLGDSCG